MLDNKKKKTNAVRRAGLAYTFLLLAFLGDTHLVHIFDSHDQLGKTSTKDELGIPQPQRPSSKVIKLINSLLCIEGAYLWVSSTCNCERQVLSLCKFWIPCPVIMA